jgi:hypothetical protein
MMDEDTREARRQARLRLSAEERRIAAIEDIAASLMDIKDELVQIRIGITVPEAFAPPPRPFRP